MILGATARAATITYSVGGWGPETYQLNSDWPGDTVAFQAFSGSLNLTPGVGLLDKLTACSGQSIIRPNRLRSVSANSTLPQVAP